MRWASIYKFIQRAHIVFVFFFFRTKCLAIFIRDDSIECSGNETRNFLPIFARISCPIATKILFLQDRNDRMAWNRVSFRLHNCWCCSNDVWASPLVQRHPYSGFVIVARKTYCVRYWSNFTIDLFVLIWCQRKRIDHGSFHDNRQLCRRRYHASAHVFYYFSDKSNANLWHDYILWK